MKTKVKTKIVHWINEDDPKEEIFSIKIYHRKNWEFVTNEGNPILWGTKKEVVDFCKILEGKIL